MAKTIRIQSTKTIVVTMGLHNKDVTNPDAHIPDRLKVSPLWPKATVMVMEGVGYYPAEIANWPTVKALAKDKIFTIGEEVESDKSEDENKETELKEKIKEIKSEATNKKKAKTETLSEIASKE